MGVELPVIDRLVVEGSSVPAHRIREGSLEEVLVPNQDLLERCSKRGTLRLGEIR